MKVVTPSARSLGVNAYLDGKPVTSCPFSMGKQRMAWVAGWYAARSEAAQC